MLRKTSTMTSPADDVLRKTSTMTSPATSPANDVLRKASTLTSPATSPENDDRQGHTSRDLGVLFRSKASQSPQVRSEIDLKSISGNRFAVRDLCV